MSNSQKNQTLELEWRVCQGPLSYKFLRNFSSDVEESWSEINKDKMYICSGQGPVLDGVTPIYSRSLRDKNTKRFVKYIYFCLWLGVLKSRILEKFGEPLQSYLLTDQADSAKKAGPGQAS